MALLGLLFTVRPAAILSVELFLRSSAGQRVLEGLTSDIVSVFGTVATAGLGRTRRVVRAFADCYAPKVRTVLAGQIIRPPHPLPLPVFLGADQQTVTWTDTDWIDELRTEQGPVVVTGPEHGGTTTLAARIVAQWTLEFLQTQIEALDNGRSSIGAVLMIASGELSRTPCDDTATAALISALKARGIFTFIPVGNDGDPTAVRFPACASDAIAISATDRTGTPLAVSNGARTNMVDLWMDGDGLVIPMHGPELVDIPGCLFPKGFHTMFEAVQSKLLDYGFDPGPVDGLPGRKTEHAVRAFQTHSEVTLWTRLVPWASGPSAYY